MGRTTIRLADVTRALPLTFTPDGEASAAMAERLGILGVRKLSFEGEIAPDGQRDWALTGHLGATVVQPCVVTLEPVTTRVEEDIARRYITGMEMPEDGEVEMPEDDTAEPAPAEIDLRTVVEEALALALPAWPRKDGVDPVEMTVTEPGATPLTEAEVKPFAALKSLKDRMEDTGDGDP
ncbi:MAG: DUF177 domain-containing protein [Pseudomonadota bacterium]